MIIRDDVHDDSEISPVIDGSDTLSMVESSPDGMLLADEHGRILLVNSRIETMFGHDRNDLIGKTIEVLLPERLRSIHTAHRTRFRAEPTSRAMGTGLALHARRKDGTEFPVEVSLSPLTGPEGMRVVATVRDVTDRLAEEARSMAVLTTIDRVADGVFMFHADDLRFTYVNAGAAAQTGYTRDELLTMGPLHIKPEFTTASFVALLEPLLAGGLASHTFTTVHRRKDGVDVPVEIILEYPEGAAGNDRTRVIVAIVRDISERLDAQAERVRLRLFEDRERIGHDLHDLVIQRLFGAGLGLQALVARPLPPDVTERIEHTIDEMDDAIRELRSTIFRLNMDDEERLSVSDRITAVVEPFESRLGFRPSLTLTGDVDTIPLVVVEQLLPSLNESLSNVTRHAQARSVSVRVSHADGRVVADVIDDGVGLGSDGHSPLGHGLANVRSRANRLRGTATMADRAEGGGTQVRWSVPSG